MSDTAKRLVEEFNKRQADFPKEKERWLYVIETFWQLKPDELLVLIKKHESFDDLYRSAEKMRDGMIAT